MAVGERRRRCGAGSRRASLPARARRLGLPRDRTRAADRRGGRVAASDQRGRARATAPDTQAAACRGILPPVLRLIADTPTKLRGRGSSAPPSRWPGSQRPRRKRPHPSPPHDVAATNPGRLADVATPGSTRPRRSPSRFRSAGSRVAAPSGRAPRRCSRHGAPHDRAVRLVAHPVLGCQLAQALVLSTLGDLRPQAAGELGALLPRGRLGPRRSGQGRDRVVGGAEAGERYRTRVSDSRRFRDRCLDRAACEVLRGNYLSPHSLLPATGCRGRPR